MDRQRREILGDKLAVVLLLIAVLTAAWAYGVLSQRFGLFPYPLVRGVVSQASAAVVALRRSTRLDLPWWYLRDDDATRGVKTYLPKRLSPGLVLVSGVGQDDRLFARIIDNHGQVLHEWNLDWFDLWPDPAHLSEDERPKSRPGTSIDGIALMPNRDLIFNFDLLGSMRVDFCGNVVWRLPYRTHHSVVPTDSGSVWVPGRITRTAADPELANYKPPYEDFTLLEVSGEGDILQEISVFDVLLRNGFEGLLYMSSLNNWRSTVSGDTLHVNDVEPFPSAMQPGIFGPGDMLVSMRNINAIVVFNVDTKTIKYVSVGQVLRQHDPDFFDGNTLSVFDNNNLSDGVGGEQPDDADLSSRIVLIDARTRKSRVIFQGTPAVPFFSDIMGRHQWLPNGNVLITEARGGRALEVTADGKLAWEYTNEVGEGLVGVIDTAERLPAEFGASEVAALAARCAP